MENPSSVPKNPPTASVAQSRVLLPAPAIALPPLAGTSNPFIGWQPPQQSIADEEGHASVMNQDYCQGSYPVEAHRVSYCTRTIPSEMRYGGPQRLSNILQDISRNIKYGGANVCRHLPLQDQIPAEANPQSIPRGRGTQPIVNENIANNMTITHDEIVPIVANRNRSSSRSFQKRSFPSVTPSPNGEKKIRGRKKRRKDAPSAELQTHISSDRVEVPSPPTGLRIPSAQQQPDTSNGDTPSSSTGTCPPILPGDELCPFTKAAKRGEKYQKVRDAADGAKFEYSLGLQIVRSVKLRRLKYNGKLLLPGGSCQVVAACHILGGTSTEDVKDILIDLGCLPDRRWVTDQVKDMVKDRTMQQIVESNFGGGVITKLQKREAEIAMSQICQEMGDILTTYRIQNMEKKCDDLEKKNKDITRKIKNMRYYYGNMKQKMEDLEEEAKELRRNLLPHTPY